RYPPRVLISPILRRVEAPSRRATSLGCESAFADGVWLDQAEGEGFEPSSDETARNGFRDRRIRPLCHPSAGPMRGPAQISRDEITVAAEAELASAGGEAARRKHATKKKGHTGETWFPP